MCRHQNMPCRVIKDILLALGPPNMLLLATWLLDDYRMDGRRVVVHVEIKYCHFTTHVACAADGREGDVEEFLPPAPSQWFPDSLCAKVKPLSRCCF